MRGSALLTNRCFSSKDKVNAARALFERALAIDPNNVEAINGLAVTYNDEPHWMGDPGTDYDAKYRPLDRAIALDPDYVDPYVIKAFT